MKTALFKTFVAVILLLSTTGHLRAGMDQSAFFRLLSPSNSAITAIDSAGWLACSNAAPSGTCSVQICGDLLATNGWQTFARLEITGTVASLRVLHPSPPSGMAYIPAGLFVMGNAMNASNEGTTAEIPLHAVYTDEFFMDTHEVTCTLWSETRLWGETNGYDIPAGTGKWPDHPATSNSWYDCVKLCNARSEKEGLTPCYYLDSTFSAVYRSGLANISNAWVNWTANGYRLPTEAEWEKAARGGPVNRRFPWGDLTSHSNANYFSAATLTNGLPCEYEIGSEPFGYHPDYYNGGEPYTSPVGSFPPNGYGLYDMAGNVYEWCWDWYSAQYYTVSPLNNPRGPGIPTSDNYRVLRGGGWHGTESAMIRCAYRSGNPPAKITENRGLRCVRRVED